MIDEKSKEIRKDLLGICEKQHIKPYQLYEIARRLCSCENCIYFTPLSEPNNKATNFGICKRTKVTKVVCNWSSICAYFEVKSDDESDSK